MSELTIAFDADDTLWHNENAFAAAEHAFDELMTPWADAATAREHLIAVERGNVQRYGYGVKSFTLSMITAACDLSKDQISAEQLRTIVDTGNRLLDMPTVLIDGAAEVVRTVAESFPTMIITKGDLHHQLRRLRVADLNKHCFDVEVVAEKDPATYERILRRHRIDPARFVMVGNSMVSDVAPLLGLGARAVHIPYEVTWALETAAADPEPSDQWFRLDAITELPDLLDRMS